MWIRLLVAAAAGLMLAACDARIADAKKLVARDLKDPGAAQFRDVKAAGRAVCGEVNSKNSYGAYVGFKRFVVVDGRARVEMDMSNVDPGNVSDLLLLELKEGAGFWPIWNEHCSS